MTAVAWGTCLAASTGAFTKGFGCSALGASGFASCTGCTVLAGKESTPACPNCHLHVSPQCTFLSQGAELVATRLAGVSSSDLR